MLVVVVVVGRMVGHGHFGHSSGKAVGKKLMRLLVPVMSTVQATPVEQSVRGGLELVTANELRRSWRCRPWTTGVAFPTACPPIEAIGLNQQQLMSLSASLIQPYEQCQEVCR